MTEYVPIEVQDAHAALRPFDSEHVGQHDHAALGSVVRGASGMPTEAADRADVDDRPPPALEHCRHDGPRGEERAREQDVDLPPPLLLPLFTTTPLISGLLASWPTLFSITALVTSRRWSLG